MRAGPKRDPIAPQLTFDELPTERPERAIAFIEGYLSIPKGHNALGPVRLMPYQKEIIRGLFQPGITQALIAMPRGNAKSTLAAFLALYAAYADGVEGARVFCLATSERQATLIFDTCRRCVELNPALKGQAQVHSDKLVLPYTDSVLRTLPARPETLQGYDPSFCVIDELAVVSDATYESLALALGKRERSMLLSISTPPVEVESAMWRLRELGLDGDPHFYFREWSAPAGCDLDDEAAWEVANPGLDSILSREALRSTLTTCREASFRRYRLGQVVADSDVDVPWGGGVWGLVGGPPRRGPPA